MTIVRKRGSTSGKARAVVKRHIPCESEFDYQGWLGLGEWKRGSTSEKDEKRDCWGFCHYPSQCRWGPHIGAGSAAAAISSISEGAMRRPVDISPSDVHQASGEDHYYATRQQQPPTTFDDILEGFELPRDKQRGQDFWSGMPVSVFGRGKSELGTIVEDEERSHVRDSSEVTKFMGLDVVITSPRIEKLEHAAMHTDSGFEASLAEFQTAFEEFGVKLDRTKSQK